MLNRWSVLFLCLGGVIGYAVGGQAVNAQRDAAHLPFSVGDRITLSYENGRNVSCVVGEIRGIYVRCDPTGVTTSIGRLRSERWQSLESVVSIVRSEE